jgi:hypothetical protein
MSTNLEEYHTPWKARNNTVNITRFRRRGQGFVIEETRRSFDRMSLMRLDGVFENLVRALVIHSNFRCIYALGFTLK